MGSKRAAASSSASKPVEWERFGLSSEPNGEKVGGARSGSEDEIGVDSQFHTQGRDLFSEDQASKTKPWWKLNFFMSEPVLFGVWDGVFTACMINLFSVIVFLRTGWIVSNAGIGQSILVVLVTVLIGTTTVLSGIGICERCHMESGGVHFILSHVLGARIGSSISLIYCFGQSVSCALHVMGFSESFCHLVSINDPWLIRVIAIAVIISLLGINVAGVKWVIRLQFGLLIILLLASLDLAVGTFVQTDPGHGVIGYDWENFKNNSGPDYEKGENWFTVFGIFFPAMTGILAGINMSGDLRSPSRDIPVGTVASVATSSFIYMTFVLGLGATCQRWALRTDYMIAQKVSAVGVLFLAGLYISALSTCLGAIYATPRIIQSIANGNVIPFMRVLGRGKGPNKVPVYSLVMFALVTFIFVMIGNINTLAPIVTIPFLLTYACLEYSYFALAMTFDIQQQREERYLGRDVQSPSFVVGEGTVTDDGKLITYGSIRDGKVESDLDQLFPERVPHHKRGMVRDGSSVTVTATTSPLSSPEEHSSIYSAESKESQGEGPKSHPPDHGNSQLYEISRKQKSWYTALCNRWVALLGAVVKVVMMFLVQWGYAAAAVLVIILTWFYIGKASPGSSRGVAEFRLFPWLKNVVCRCFGCRPTDYDQIVVAPDLPNVEVKAAQLTEDNADYASRERFHHSKRVDNIAPQYVDSD